MADDPCVNHRVLDDYRRSPLYQPRTPRDVLCDRTLIAAWYRFTIQNRFVGQLKIHPINSMDDGIT